MPTTVSRNGLTVKQWKIVKEILPSEKPAGKGRPNKSHYLIITAIFWILRTGAPWRDMPERFGSWSTVYSRFYRWTNQGIWEEILKALQQQADVDNRINWTIHHVDGSVIRAHQHAAGARKIGTDGQSRTKEDLALGRSRGGFGTKIHIRVEGGGKPMVLVITPGETQEVTVFEQLMNGGNVKRKRRGRPKKNPDALAGDKGYTGKKPRALLKNRKIKDVIPTRVNERHYENFDKELYKQRNFVERTFNCFKQCRRIATRYEKLAKFYLAMLTIAAFVMWL